MAAYETLSKPDVRALDMTCMRILAILAKSHETLSAIRTTRTISRQLGWHVESSDAGKHRFYVALNKLEMWGYVSVRGGNSRAGCEQIVTMQPKGWALLKRQPPIWNTEAAA